MMEPSSKVIHATPVPQEEPPDEEHLPSEQQQGRVLQVLESETAIVPQDEVFLKGEAQPPEFHDKPFAIAFLLQIATIIGICIALAPAAFQENDANDDTDAIPQDEPDDDVGVKVSSMIWVWLVGPSITAVAAVAVTLLLMMRFPNEMIRVAFFATPILFLVIAVLTVADEESREDGLPAVYASFAAVFTAISVLFYFCYRRFMPFAASTLRTAISAVQAHKGLLVVSVGNGLIAFGWIILWFTAFVSYIQHVQTTSPQEHCVEYDEAKQEYVETQDMCDATPNPFVVVLFVLALYWTQQVIQNVLHVTTAGTVGTWWFTSPMTFTSSFCGMQEVGHSLYRALTYSFGSICLGSLLIALMQTLESMLRSARRNRRGSALLLCILECLVHLLRRWMEYFNSWAMVYVGLYGYPYMTAGRNVIKLFKSTGWTTFISDRLVFRVLLLCHLSIGVLTGFSSALLDGMLGPVLSSSSSSGSNAEEDDRMLSHFAAFFIGALLGMFISSSALFVVESAVRTIIVCFAESPAEFQVNHPDLCEEMVQGWSETYPEAWVGRRHAQQAEVTTSTMSVPMAKSSISIDESETHSLV